MDQIICADEIPCCPGTGGDRLKTMDRNAGAWVSDDGIQKPGVLSMTLVLVGLLALGCGKKGTEPGTAVNQPGTPGYIPPAESQEFVVNGEIDPMKHTLRDNVFYGHAVVDIQPFSPRDFESPGIEAELV